MNCIMRKVISVEEIKCNRCGYCWFPKIVRGKIIIPISCANLECKSLYWNKQRTRKRKTN